MYSVLIHIMKRMSNEQQGSQHRTNPQIEKAPQDRNEFVSLGFRRWFCEASSIGNFIYTKQERPPPNLILAYLWQTYIKLLYESLHNIEYKKKATKTSLFLDKITGKFEWYEKSSYFIWGII